MLVKILVRICVSLNIFRGWILRKVGEKAIEYLDSRCGFSCTCIMKAGNYYNIRQSDIHQMVEDYTSLFNPWSKSDSSEPWLSWWSFGNSRIADQYSVDTANGTKIRAKMLKAWSTNNDDEIYLISRQINDDFKYMYDTDSWVRRWTEKL